MAFCGANRVAQETVPSGWQRIDADGYFAFYLPSTMQLRSTERCEECAWGSTYADERIRLHATYTSWDEGYSSDYLLKQAEYQIETIELAGKKATVQSWRTSDVSEGFGYIVEARLYGVDKRLVARFSAACKSHGDLETAKQIFRTACCFKS
jgi:hypothetical protein